VQSVVGEMQFHVDRRPWRMAPSVGQRLLHDAVGSKFDARIEGCQPAADDEPGSDSRYVPRLVEELVELGEARLGLAVSGLDATVLAQHPEQPSHLR
jgi:hypothetical protein